MKKLLKQLLYMNIALLLAVLFVIPVIAEDAVAIQHILTLYKNDGSDTVKNETNIPGTGYALVDYLFQRDSCVQVAWAESADGTPTHRLNALYVPATSTDLYAFWLEIEAEDLDSGVVVLNGLQGDLDENGAFYQKNIGTVTLPAELYNYDLLAWSTDLQPVVDQQGVFSGRWYIGGEDIIPEMGKILNLYGQPTDGNHYVIYHPNGGSVVRGGQVLVQKTVPGNLENYFKTTALGEDAFVAPEYHILAGWAKVADAERAAYKPGTTVNRNEQLDLYAVWQHVHAFTDYKSDNNAKCGQAGTKTAVCNMNGCTAKDTIVDEGSALEHKYINYISNNDATCTKDGTKTAVCDNGCGTEDTVIETGTALGHKDKNTDNQCDVCNVQLCTEHHYDGTVLSYEWSEEDCVVIQSCTVCTYGKLYTPVVFQLTKTELTMSHVPSGVLILIAAYENGQMCNAQMETAAAAIPLTLQGDEVRVFFVDQIDYRPMMKCLITTVQ